MRSVLAVLLLASPVAAADAVVLKPARVFDGVTFHEGWLVVVRGERIEAAAGNVQPPEGARIVELPGFNASSYLDFVTPGIWPSSESLRKQMRHIANMRM